MADHDHGPLDGWADAAFKQGQTDVVQDVLGLTAERLNSLYKENFEETKGFLRWLGRNFLKPDARIDDLSGKTKLRRFAEYPFQEILSVLKQNRKHLTINPTDRGFQEQFEQAFNASVAKQRPRFQAAQRLAPWIETLVYRLYRLSAADLSVVEDAAALIQYK